MKERRRGGASQPRYTMLGQRVVGEVEVRGISETVCELQGRIRIQVDPEKCHVESSPQR